MSSRRNSIYAAGYRRLEVPSKEDVSSLARPAIRCPGAGEDTFGDSRCHRFSGARHRCEHGNFQYPERAVPPVAAGARPPATGRNLDHQPGWSEWQGPSINADVRRNKTAPAGILRHVRVEWWRHGQLRGEW